MGALCSSTAQVAPPPRTQRQLTAFIRSDSEDGSDPPMNVGRARSESLKEEDLKKHIALLLKEKEAPPPRPLPRQESSKRVRFPRQQELTKVYEYTPDALYVK